MLCWWIEVDIENCCLAREWLHRLWFLVVVRSLWKQCIHVVAMWEQLHWYWSTQEWTWVYCTSHFSSCISVFSYRCHCRFYIAFSCFLVSGLLVASFLETLVGLVRTSLSFLAMLRHLQKRRSVIPLDFGGQAVRPLELFSDATGVDEKLDRDCRRELLERHTFHSDSLLSVFSHQLWWQDNDTPRVSSGRRIAVIFNYVLLQPLTRMFKTLRQ